jgi:hypothetical protein
MQTSKLYSEILEKINTFGEVICKDENGKDCEAIDDFKYPELAQSIEQLLLDKMEGFANWLFLWKQNSIGEWKHQNKNEIVKTTKELIQLYLNK